MDGDGSYLANISCIGICNAPAQGTIHDVMAANLGCIASSHVARGAAGNVLPPPGTLSSHRVRGRGKDRGEGVLVHDHMATASLTYRAQR